MSTLFTSGQLTYNKKLKQDAEADNRFFKRLLEHPSFSVGEFKEQPNSAFGYIGDVEINGTEIHFQFMHDKDGYLTSLNVKSQDNMMRKLIAQVIIENTEAIVGAKASLGSVKKQPNQLKIRKRNSVQGSSNGKSSVSYKESLGYLGEKAFVEFWKENFPKETLDWPNEEKDAGLPYDVLISQTLTVDVKATRSENAEVSLSQNEIDFHSENKERHVIALVTFDTVVSSSPNKVLLIDLYMGHPLRSVALADVTHKIQELEPLQPQAAAEAALPVQAVESAPDYLPRGIYVSLAQELTLAANTYTLRAVGRQGEETGHFYLRGNQLVLQDEDGSETQSFTVCKEGLRYGDDVLKLAESREA
ncbi:DUF3883 domain-containing protein [Deinococcus wulumuqiensis]|uniref:DUF3883 domain-containing protein n=1 Tax=Deinococcus wulumuqiensis TaxID=980427 RepID=UPI0024315348|nr:DUF3883 domain-containing protein [Deinococcus wulumuqiensis]